MRARLATAAVAGLVAALAPTQVAPASAATTGVYIYGVRYDSAGADTGSNASLNDEYIVLKNNSTTTKTITGWTVRDKAGYVYTFGTTNLAAGAYTTVHTGSGTYSSRHRYWGRTWYVWNNSGDTAYLRNTAGTLKDSCSWGSGGSVTSC